jgi:hypothetical protein
MTDDYRIEKSRLSVVVVTAGGERMAGELFVQPFSRYRMGPEQAPDIMNGAEPFFPFATADGDTVLIAKDQVREVEIAFAEGEEVEPESAAGARSALIEVTLSDGAAVSGSVYLQAPTDRPRLLDFLNRFDSRFLTLYAPGGARLVNRRLIERVRPLD